MSDSSQSDWQSLPRLALFPVGLYLIRRFLSNFLPAVLGAGAGIAILADFGLRDSLLGLLAISLAVLLYAFAWHRRFAYRLTTDAIQVRRGVLHRQELRIAWERVRNVDLRQAFYLKPLGMVTLILETPGGESEEIQIYAMPKAAAEAVRDQVSGARLQAQGSPGGVVSGDAEASEDSEGAEHALHEPSDRALFVHGIVSGQFWLIFAGVGALYGYFHRQLLPHMEVAASWALGQTREWLTPENPLVVMLPILIGLTLSVLFLLAISGLIGWVRYYRYRLLSGVDNLCSRYGLLETRERTLRHAKLQAFTLTQTLLGRWAGLSHMKGHQASAAGEFENPQGDGVFLVPALVPEKAPALVSYLVPSMGRTLALDRGNVRGIDPRFHRFWWTRLSVGLLLIVGLLLALGVGQSMAAAVTLALLVGLGPALLWPILRLRWHRWGWALSEDCVLIQSGFFGWSREVFEVRRIQQVRVAQSPFQRRVGLANLECGLADYARVIPFIPYDEAVALSNYLLYRLESEPELLL